MVVVLSEGGLNEVVIGIFVLLFFSGWKGLNGKNRGLSGSSFLNVG